MCPYNSTLKAKADFLGWHERAEVRADLFAISMPFCFWCERTVSSDWRADEYFSADHIVPRKDGGAYMVENLVVTCRRCNADRGDRSIIVFLAERGNDNG